MIYTFRKVAEKWSAACSLEKGAPEEELLKRPPLPGNFARWIYRTLRSKRPVANSADYWKKRRSTGGDCSVGSHAFFAECAKFETPGAAPEADQTPPACDLSIPEPDATKKPTRPPLRIGPSTQV